MAFKICMLLFLVSFVLLDVAAVHGQRRKVTSQKEVKCVPECEAPHGEDTLVDDENTGVCGSESSEEEDINEDTVEIQEEPKSALLVCALKKIKGSCSTKKAEQPCAVVADGKIVTDCSESASDVEEDQVEAEETVEEPETCQCEKAPKKATKEDKSSCLAAQDGSEGQSAKSKKSAHKVGSKQDSRTSPPAKSVKTPKKQQQPSQKAVEKNGSPSKSKKQQARGVQQKATKAKSLN